jgi:HlyD family secretion protein
MYRDFFTSLAEVIGHVMGLGPGVVTMATTREDRRVQGPVQVPGGASVAKDQAPKPEAVGITNAARTVPAPLQVPGGAPVAKDHTPKPKAVMSTKDPHTHRKGWGWASTVGKWLLGASLIAIAALAYLVWGYNPAEKLPKGFASANGRIEATEIDVATKLAGRITDMVVDEGDFVTAGQVVARMQTDVLDAELRQAQAKLREAKSEVESSKSTVMQRDSEKLTSLSVVAQRVAEYDLATKNLARGEELILTGAMSKEDVDIRRSNLYTAKAVIDASKAKVAAADAAIATARSLVVTADANVEEAQAAIQQIRADIDDSVLRAPRDGRVQYRVAQLGEVLAAGGKVLNMVDLSEVYMSFFLATDAAGRVSLGAEVNLVLDAIPQYVIPSRVSYVADVAQFTPKTVETAEERQKLTFRIKARIDPALLNAHIRDVKTGLPGMAYVRLDPKADWPERLQVRLPQ